MSSYVRIRACPNPSTFFDEIIPEHGIKVSGWRFCLLKIPLSMNDNKGTPCVVDSKWLYAEHDCDEMQLKSFAIEMLPKFRQLIRSFVGIRNLRLSGDVKFTMFFEEFVKDGVSRNIEPYKINVGVGILNVRVLDENGEVKFDAIKAKAERALQLSKNVRDELRLMSADILVHLDDDYYRRAWESFSLAQGASQHAISHLYDVRDAIATKFGSGHKAREVLDLGKDEWDEFGKIFNASSLEGGRHNGIHPAPMKPMATEQRISVMQFAEKLILAYGNYLRRF